MTSCLRSRILIVDDESETVAALARLFRRLDCDIDSAGTIEEASRTILDRDYRAIVTDLRLTPGTGEEGLEVLRRAREKNLSTEVIIVTGYGNPSLMTKAFDLGAAYYFEKPVHPAQLLGALEELCR
ncbi:MAG TPA: response regulator [Thermoanaerobaculia bacterium]|nr:response regulator [Thermoanaerobaculia bacterium]